MNTFETESAANVLAEHHLMCFDGKKDTHKYSRIEYRNVSLRSVWAMAETPGNKPKDDALALMASSYCGFDGRDHPVQREHGQFVVLRVDIDKGETTLEQLRAALVAFAGPGVALCIYSTSSASPTVRKWRGILPLSEPVSYEVWHRLQRALHLHLTKHGIQFDGSMERAGQYMVAPNKTSDFWQFHVNDGDGLDVSAQGDSVEQALAELDAADALVEQAAQEARKRAAERKSARVGTGTHDGLIEAYNAANSVSECFARYGFDTRNDVDWNHPQLQTSGSYSWRDFGDHWVCASASARENGIGGISANRFGFGDAFDLYVHFEHGGNQKAAVEAAAQSVMVADPETGEILTWHELTRAQWRQQQADAEFESVDISDLLAKFKSKQEGQSAPDPYPGPMADLVAATLATSRRQQPAMALLSAIAAMAAGCPGNFCLPAGGRLNVYALGVLVTGMGKEHPRTVAEIVAATAGASVIGAPASGEGLEDALPERSDMGLLMAIDEVAHLLGSLNDQKAAPYQRTLAANMLKLFSASAGGYRGRVKAGLPGRFYAHPSLTMLGFSTPEKLGTAVGLDSVTDGLLGRMLVLFGDDCAVPQRPMTGFWMPESVGKMAQRIKAQSSERTQIVYDPQADARLERALQEFEVGARDPTEAALRRRSYEKTDRIAGVLAVWDCPEMPVVTLAHVEWAIGLVEASNAAIWRFLNQHMHEGLVQSNAAKVFDWCKRVLTKEVIPDRAGESEAIDAGAVPKSLVLKRSKLSAKDLTDAVQQLVMQGDLETAIFKPKTGREYAVLKVL